MSVTEDQFEELMVMLDERVGRSHSRKGKVAAALRDLLAAHEQMIEIWSVSDVAWFLGISRQRVNQLYNSFPDELPEFGKLSGATGPRLWAANTWRTFAENTDRWNAEL